MPRASEKLKRNNTNQKARKLGKNAGPKKSAGFLEDSARMEIAGVLCALVALILFCSAVLAPDALITNFIASTSFLLFGIGAYVLPMLLLVIAACFLVRFEKEHMRLRIAFGLVLLFVSFIGIIALYVPGAELQPYVLFASHYASSYGGLVGSCLAFALISLVGMLLSHVVLLALALIACIIIGFSFTTLIDKLRRYQEERLLKEGLTDENFASAGLYRSTRRPWLRTIDRFRRKILRLGFDESRMRIDSQSSDRLPSIGEDTQVLASEEGLPLRNNAAKLATQHIQNSRRSPSKDASATQVLNPTRDTILPDQMTRKLGSVKKSECQEKSKNTPAQKGSSVITAAATLENAEFSLPDPALLHISKADALKIESDLALEQTAQNLQQTLEDFGVYAHVVDWVAGPTVTLFKIELPSGVRVSKIENLDKDIALALASPGVRIFAPIPGTNYVGIEVPNAHRQSVLLGDILPSAKAGPLQMAIGRDVEGASIVSDLAKMPHLLIAGTTGSGKSVSINAMIMSILMRATPEEVRFIMIDPKRVEFTPYNGIPHLYVPVVNEDKEAASALAWCVAEMERRLKVLSQVGVRNITQFNKKVQEGLMINDVPADHMPYIVVIIDELADLMMNVGKDVETYIARLAQLARAAGIHLIVATQRPSTNVVTGLIKSNITNRISFNVASGIDSRVILDQTGAENLIGLGDLLFNRPDLGKPIRIQGCYVSEEEIFNVVEFLKEQGDPDYHNEILTTNVMGLADTSPTGGSATGPADPLLWEAANLVVSSQVGSTSYIQRRLSVGYARAGRIMDMLEERGVVGPANGSKPRDVLVDEMELETLKAFEMND